MKILITGVAGFIGFHLAQHFANTEHQITAIDNINDYYDVDLKYRRLCELGFANLYNECKALSEKYPNLYFEKIDITDTISINDLFKTKQFDVVVHLAAQAGIRYSLQNPSAYITANVQGFLNILEACRYFPVKHLVYASSSSVYGLSDNSLFCETDRCDKPISLYAVSKKTNELMAYTYTHLYKIPITGLRFFTVYGPWGRPDMAPFIFTKNIIEDKEISVFNNGDMQRDFTYIDDIIEGIVRIMSVLPTESKVYNIGMGHPIKLTDFINCLEVTINKKAKIKFIDIQPGDVISTHADCSALEKVTGYKPSTSLETGIRKFINWYKINYGV